MTHRLIAAAFAIAEPDAKEVLKVSSRALVARMVTPLRTTSPSARAPVTVAVLAMAASPSREERASATLTSMSSRALAPTWKKACTNSPLSTFWLLKVVVSPIRSSSAMSCWTS